VQTTYYRDVDNDSYGTGATTTGACSQPAGYVSNASDCNDNNIYEYPGQTWYVDADNDNWSNGSTLVQCADP